MTSAALAGATGLVGSHVLTTLLSEPSISTVNAFTRRPLSNSSPKLHPIEASDPANGWPTSFPAGCMLFVSALGTTRAAAGSFAAQRAIDLDLNLSLARAAKDSGVGTYVLVSSGGASSGSVFPYMRVKGELEDAVRDVGFDHLVILRPGLLRGDRGSSSRLAERFFSAAITMAGKVAGQGVEDGLAQNADVVARAAVAAGMRCVRAEKPPGVWEVSSKEIVQLGRTEWRNPGEEGQ